MFSTTLPEEAAFALLLAPATDAAGRSSAALNTKLGHKILIIVTIDQGNAATVTLTPEQCSDTSGTGNKAIPATKIWANQDALASSVLTAQTDAATFTTSATLKKKMVIFEIRPESLDIAGGFQFLRITTGASNAANLTYAHAVLVPGRYAGVTVPNVLA